MTPNQKARLISMFATGLVTARECANKVLGVLVDGEERSLFVQELPKGIQDEFLVLLRQIEAANYIHTPFLIGGSPSPYDPAKLREICQDFLPSSGQIKLVGERKTEAGRLTA